MIKDNAAETLDKELSKEKWNKKWTVNMATVTDPYQPVEHKFKITREVLKVFLKHHNAFLVTTKSDLILRDLDILTEIAQTGFLNIYNSLVYAIKLLFYFARSIYKIRDYWETAGYNNDADENGPAFELSNRCIKSNL